MSEDQTTKQTSLQGDFLANHSALQEREEEQTMIATSGMKLLELSKSANPNGLLEKMLKALLTSKTAWYSDRCKMIWKSKVSKSGILLFQLQASVRGIKGKESGLLPTTYPTPTTMDHIDRKGMRPSRAATNRKTGYLSEMIHMYPTPTSVQRPNEGNMRMMRKQVLQGNISKEEASAMVGKDVFKEHGKVKMYPTPTPTCENGGEQSNRVEQTKSGGFVLRKKNKPNMTFGAKLSDAMLYLEKKKMYGTPKAQDCRAALTDRGKGNFGEQVHQENNAKKHGGRLNPEFVEFLMAYPQHWTKVEPTE